MKKTMLSIFTMLYSVVLFSQDLPEVLPPSPEAASLIKYSQTDISPYTGLPNISIPFHTISYKDVNIPIGLSYSGGGNKVSDIASWVGLGWNLQAGGLVTRTIRGLPDDNGNVGYMNTTKTVKKLIQGDGNYLSSEINIIYQAPEIVDYEPDIFNFSFPGGSGKFFYDQELGKFVQDSKSNIKIEAIQNTNHQITAFEITTPDGIKYLFGVGLDSRQARESIKSANTLNYNVYQSETSRGNTAYYTGMNTYQSWMLMDIVFPTSNDKISFNYTYETAVQAIIFQGQDFIKPEITNTSNELGVEACLQESLSSSYIEKTFDMPKISSINFPSGKIVFEKGETLRLDLNNSYPLKYIKLFNVKDQLIKQFELKTSYFVSSDNNNLLPFGTNYDSQRLKLDAIHNYDKNVNEKLPYTFTYNATALPNRFSKGIDYFGYYNGKINQDLIPKSRYQYKGNMLRLGKADRAIDPAYTKAGVLEKITLPTGGSEEFVWENNLIVPPMTINPDENEYVDYLLKEVIAVQNTSLFLDPSPNITYSKTFTIDSNSNGWLEFDITMAGCTGPQLNNTNCAYVLKLEGVDTSLNMSVLENKFEKKLIPGKTYKFSATSRTEIGCDPLTDPSCQGIGSPLLNAVLTYTKDPTPGEYMYGGLRIKKINTYSEESTQTLSFSREYNYNEFQGGLSSGRTLRFIDNYMDNFNIFCYQKVCIKNKCNDAFFNTETFKLYSDNTSSIVYTKGNLVGYKNVTETYIGSDSQKNGKTEYFFSFNDYPLNPFENQFDSTFPKNFENLIEVDWQNGNLEQKRVYDNSNRLLKQEVNNYESEGNYIGQYFGVQLLKMPYITNTGSIGHNYRINSYNYATEYFRLKSKGVTTYFNDVPVTTVTTYNYNNNPLLYSEMTVANSKGEVLKTINFYPEDVVNVSSLGHDDLTTTEFNTIKKLQRSTVSNPTGQYQIATPIQVETYEGNTLLSTQRTNFLTSGSGMVLPEKVQVSKGTGVLEDRVVYHSYDD
ncbi:hypothetical protein, partial [Tenacibaculum aiptasiae]|uniref:hypothetical protein n=1 Tax=Tenacibaculum aiptasiae TaxID=426481 RepID=UPI002330B548